MATYIHEASSGRLESYCPEDHDPTDEKLIAPAEVLESRGLVLKQGLPPLDAYHVWNEETATVVATTPAPSPILVKKAAWAMRFTSDEFRGITESDDAEVRHWVFAFNSEGEFIDLSGAQYQFGVPSLKAKGLIAEERVPILLAP